jgi:predicted alpha/beta hydrolase
MDYVTTDDGHRLAFTTFAPGGNRRDECKGAVLIVGAMGVRQDYYAPFARHLASQGFSVTAFDYRGMGYSRNGNLRDLDADILTWARHDVPAMVKAVREAHPGRPLLMVAHSLGGQILGLVPGHENVDAMFTVASGTGYYKHNKTMPFRVRFLWYFAMPVYTWLFGYFPGKKLRKVGDLPRGVALQWTQWCKHPEYIVDERGNPMHEGHAKVRIPIFGLSFEDDEFIPKPAIDQLHGFYRSAHVERRHMAPREVDSKRIGHFGFFTERLGDKLWPLASAWLSERAAHSAQGASPAGSAM